MAVQHEIDAANAALSRSTYSNFTSAGLDLFTTGASQDPDSFSSLINVMPSETGGFRLRWGLVDVATPAAFNPIRTFSFNATQDGSDVADTSDVNLLISTDNQNWQTMSVTNSTAPTPLTNTLSFAPFTGHGPANFAHSGKAHGVSSRRWFYYSNGVDAPRKVNPGYTTANTESNWGIAPPIAYFRDNDADTTAISTIAAVGGTGTGYVSPTVTISGGGGTGAAATAILKNGMITGFAMTSQGSGYTSTPNVEITDSSGTGAAAVAVYNDQGVISAVLPSGPIVLNQGRTYTYAWRNHISGHVSGLATGVLSGGTLESYVGKAATVLSPALGVIGNVPNGQVGFTQIVVTITPVGTIDPQVDRCILLATADGGDLEKLYEVKRVVVNAASPGTLTITDILPDTITDQSLAGSSGGQAISMSGVHAKVYSAGASNGIFDATSSSTPLFEQDFNSLMFNTHPVTLTDGFAGILPGYGDNNANQDRPFTNQATTALGTWSNDVPVAGGGHSAGASGPDFNFQMILTGTFHVAAPGNVTFGVYCDAAHVVGIGGGATHVSGLQIFGGVTSTPLNHYPSLFGQNDDTEDWHFTASDPKVVNFPAAGDYPFEICYATANHDEREFAMIANGSVIVDAGSSSITNYEGLTLLNANLWVDTDSYGSLFGIVNNDPPPANLILPTAHQGRIFATDGLNVFFSKSIDEVTTSTGLITSKWEEAWPSDNVLPIALNNERVLGLKSDGTNLHIGTDHSIYTLTGTSPADFSIPNTLFQQTGILSQDTWTVIYAEGEPAGFMWITPDLKMMYSDFSTYRSVGDAIYPLLSLWDSTYTPHAKMVSFTYGPLSLVALAYKPVSSATAQYLIFDTKLKKWYQWNPQVRNSGPLSTFVYQHPPTGYRGLFYIENDGTNAHYRLFDPTVASDGGGINIPWQVRTNWQSMGDPNALKTLNELEVGTTQTGMGVAIFGARTQADLNTPVLLSNGTLRKNPLGTWKFFTAGVDTNARYYQFQFTSAAASQAGDVLTYFSAQHYPQARF